MRPDKVKIFDTASDIKALEAQINDWLEQMQGLIHVVEIKQSSSSGFGSHHTTVSIFYNILN